MGISLAVLFILFTTLAMSKSNKEETAEATLLETTIATVFVIGWIMALWKIIDWVKVHITLN